MNISFFYVGGACFILNIDSTIQVAVDPALAPKGSIVQFKSFETERMKEPFFDTETFKNIDLWLITHAHKDHLDEEGIKNIDSNSLVITNLDAIPLLGDQSNKKVMKWNQEFVVNLKGYEITIKAIPAYHGSNYIMRKLVGRVNGYLLKVKKGLSKKVIYITSDTVFHQDVIRNIVTSPDILIANLGEVMPQKFGGPLTMSVSMLNSFVEVLNPRLIIPIHIDDFSHYTTSIQNVIEHGYRPPLTGEWMKL